MYMLKITLLFTSVENTAAYVLCPLHSVPQTTWPVICYHNISQYNETQHTSR